MDMVDSKFMANFYTIIKFLNTLRFRLSLTSVQVIQFFSNLVLSLRLRLQKTFFALIRGLNQTNCRNSLAYFNLKNKEKTFV